MVSTSKTSKEILPHLLKTHPVIKTDIVKAFGSIMYDYKGNEYIDFESGMWCTILGHNHPYITKVIHQQVRQVVHLNPRLTNYIADELANQLSELLKSDCYKSIFLSSGSEAVELAIRFAKLLTNRKKMLCFSESYLSAHGNAGNLSEDLNWQKVSLTYCHGCEQVECSVDCKNLSFLHFPSLAAFVFEPGSSGGRVIIPPAKLVSFLAENVKKNGGLIIVDEVTTGFGRTGKWFGFQHYNIEPDILCLGKGLGNGYPISSVTIKKEISKSIENTKFYYVQSHQNDPLGCAIGKGVIEIIKKEQVIEHSENYGESFYYLLKNIVGSSAIVRGKGLMIALELKYLPEHAPDLVFFNLMKQGFFVGCNAKAKIIRFFPPLNIDEKHILNITHELEKIMHTLQQSK